MIVYPFARTFPGLTLKSFISLDYASEPAVVRPFQAFHDDNPPAPDSVFVEPQQSRQLSDSRSSPSAQHVFDNHQKEVWTMNAPTRDIVRPQ